MAITVELSTHPILKVLYPCHLWQCQWFISGRHHAHFNLSVTSAEKSVSLLYSHKDTAQQLGHPSYTLRKRQQIRGLLPRWCLDSSELLKGINKLILLRWFIQVQRISTSSFTDISSSQLVAGRLSLTINRPALLLLVEGAGAEECSSPFKEQLCCSIPHR